MKKTSIQRLATSAVAMPAALAVVFLAPGDAAFVFFLGGAVWAAAEFIRMARRFAPSAPVRSLLLLIPLAALGLFVTVRVEAATEDLGLWLMAAGGGLVVAAACVTLMSGTEKRDGLTAIGILAFAVPYFAFPPVALYLLQALDPWLLFILFVMVWIGDTAAYYFGTWLGRHKLAPEVSPNKSWEGAIAGFAAGLAAAAIWSLSRLGEVSAAWMAVAALTCIAAQLGDLVESLIKRGAGVKDSSNVLPGHGGFFDRLDAILLATPVFTVGAWMLGFDSLVPG